MGNVVVGQSGGPTAVINGSVLGVYQAAKELGADHVLGMVHGIQGFLEKISSVWRIIWKAVWEGSFCAGRPRPSWEPAVISCRRLQAMKQSMSRCLP